ncbi:MAG: 50S ribosomal protein L11 methyltransferase [Peptococcaceae bacterium]|nr:50S ribosomal protein L11 methyltransferase [Peptococcaceae bacterium]
MNWMEIAVTVSSAGEEAVTDIFYRLGCQGVCVESPELVKEYIESGTWDCHIFGEIEPKGQCIVKGYFPEDDDLESKVLALREELFILKQLFPDWVIESAKAMVKEEDWAHEWKKYFKPMRIGKNFVVKPSWEEFVPQQGQVVIEIDPGMAFGTGTHATTSLCLQAIEEHVKPDQLVFDIGTGSGILAIAAAKLGAKVQAGDIDKLAVKIARENVMLNGLEDRVEVRAGNLGEVFTGRADVVVANIIAEVIIELLPQLPSLMKPEGIFLACGLIAERVKEVTGKMEEQGLEVVGSMEEAGWVLLKARFR